MAVSAGVCPIGSLLLLSFAPANIGTIREARFTALPMTVNSIRSGDPMLPTIAGPVLIPLPKR